MIRVINKKTEDHAAGVFTWISSMITDRIGLQERLLQLDHNYNKMCDILEFFKIKTQEIPRVFC